MRLVTGLITQGGREACTPRYTHRETGRHVHPEVHTLRYTRFNLSHTHPEVYPGLNLSYPTLRYTQGLNLSDTLWYTRV